MRKQKKQEQREVAVMGGRRTTREGGEVWYSGEEKGADGAARIAAEISNGKQGEESKQASKQKEGDRGRLQLTQRRRRGRLNAASILAESRISY